MRQTKVLTTIDQLLSFLHEDVGEAPIWYRGVGNRHDDLIPTLHRQEFLRQNESDMLNRFKQNAHEFLDFQPQTEWEWMFLMRHHGVPSRLMDWTENPLIGLFFAVTFGNQHTSHGTLWCLDPIQFNRENYPALDLEYIPMFPDATIQEDRGESQFLDQYQVTRVSPADELSQGIAPAAAIGARITKRMQAQRGVFTIHHADKTPLNLPGHKKDHLWSYVIPKACKEHLAEELRLLGINDLSVFPDLDSVAKESIRR